MCNDVSRIYHMPARTIRVAAFLPLFTFLTHLRISTPPTFLWVSRQNEGGVESNGDRVLTFITPSDVMNATCTQPLEHTFPFRRTSCIAVMLFTACIFVVMISDSYEHGYTTQPPFSQIPNIPKSRLLPQGYKYLQIYTYIFVNNITFKVHLSVIHHN